MPNEKFVDGDFLAKLVSGSYESAMGAVSEAVSDQSDLFGSDETMVLATYAEHFVAATPGGKFFRARWGMDGDAAQISEIEEINVPVYEANEISLHTRTQAMQAVDSLLGGDDEVASDHLRQMVSAGPSMTLEGVPSRLKKLDVPSSDWYQAVHESREKILNYVGTDGTKLESTIEVFLGEGVEDRDQVVSALRVMERDISALMQRTENLPEVDEGSEIEGEDAEAVNEYVDFVDNYASDLIELSGAVEDALALSEDGDLDVLAAIHDTISGQMYGLSLAAAFAETMARGFSPNGGS